MYLILSSILKRLRRRYNGHTTQNDHKQHDNHSGHNGHSGFFAPRQAGKVRFRRWARLENLHGCRSFIDNQIDKTFQCKGICETVAFDCMSEADHQAQVPIAFNQGYTLLVKVSIPTRSLFPRVRHVRSYCKDV